MLITLSLACVFQCLLTFMLISASHWLVEISQLSRQGTTVELEVEWIEISEVYVVGHGWLEALLPFPTAPPEHPGELARRLVTIWLGASLGRSNTLIVICNVHCTYKLITKLTHLHTHIFLQFSIPVVMCTFLLAWGFSSFSPHPYLNITLPNISCYFIIQVIKCLTFKKWSKVLC